MPERLCTADRADSWGARPPVECCQHNTDSTHRSRKSRFRQRVCPRKGCEAVYTPRTGNQRYCQDPQCRQEVRRWQAAGRQKQRRLRPEVRQSQAAAAKVARLRKSLLKLHPPLPAKPIVPTEPPQSPGASSRSRKNSGPICARVGCYEPPAPAARCPTRYCSGSYRQTMQQPPIRCPTQLQTLTRLNKVTHIPVITIIRPVPARQAVPTASVKGIRPVLRFFPGQN